MDASLLTHFEGLCASEAVSLFVLDAEGGVIARSGADASPLPGFSLGADGLEVETAAGLEHAIVESVATGWTVIVGADGQLVQQLAFLVGQVEEKDRLEQDMESMYASSLALLEEVAMVGDIMPRLSSGEGEQAVVQLALSDLLVAASLRRAFYVRYHAESDQCEVLSHLVMDEDGRRVVESDEGLGWIPNQGLVQRALRGAGGTILETVPEGGRLGQPGDPEHFTQQDVIAVPVQSGDLEHGSAIGVILLMDKAATSYSNATHLGSQEGKLAMTVAAMLGSVIGTRQAAELAKEMNMANEIQRQILPDRPAEVSGFDLAGTFVASGAVGGDYFDFLPMADGSTLAVVADVSGHNLASGMVMVSARATLRSLTSVHDDAASVFTALGTNLHEDLSTTERFITAAGVALRPDEDVVRVVNAGHNDTMIYRAATGTVERVPSENTVLGFVRGIEYEETSHQLAPDDVVLLYTDGITEATDADGVMFEEERLTELLSRFATQSAEGILDSILGAVREFADKNGESDDITVVVIKRVGHEV